MNKKWKIALAVGSVVIALVVAAVAVTGYALAQQPPPPQSWGDDSPGPRMGRGPGRMGRGDWMQPHREQMEEAVAEALGISVAELETARGEGQTIYDIALEQGVEFADVQAAIEAARQEAIEQAVADGKISEEMAERILERMEQMPPAGWMQPYHDQMQEAVAESLGISVEELEAARTARAEGQPPAEIAESLGVDPDEFRQAMQDAHEEIVEQAVADGVLTPEQAERISQGQGQGRRPGFDMDCRCRCRGRQAGPGGQFKPRSPGGDE